MWTLDSDCRVCIAKQSTLSSARKPISCVTWVDGRVYWAVVRLRRIPCWRLQCMLVSDKVFLWLDQWGDQEEKSEILSKYATIDTATGRNLDKHPYGNTIESLLNQFYYGEWIGRTNLGNSISIKGFSFLCCSYCYSHKWSDGDRADEGRKAPNVEKPTLDGWIKT